MATSRARPGVGKVAGLAVHRSGDARHANRRAKDRRARSLGGQLRLLQPAVPNPYVLHLAIGKAQLKSQTQASCDPWVEESNLSSSQRKKRERSRKKKLIVFFSRFKNMAVLGRPKKSKKQKTLEESLGLHALPNTEGGNVDPQQEKDSKKKHHRVFLESWKISHPWLYCIVDNNGNERVKCRWCSFARRKNPFAQQEGATSLMKAAFVVHESSKEHTDARAMWFEHERRSTLPMEKHVASMMDDEKERILSCMQTSWYVVKRSLPLEEYPRLCGFQRFMKTPNMPLANEYSSYTSTDAGKDFAKALEHVYFDRLMHDIKSSPFFSVQVDESTDISVQQYMIVYITYIENGGNGCVCTKFVKLLQPRDAAAEALHDVLVGFLRSVGISMSKMVGIATDGASVMMGSSTGLVARLKREIPHLVSFHCIAHRESLAANDAFNMYKEFKYVDKIAKRLYEWTSRSAKRHAFLADVVKLFGIGRRGKLRPQKMHDVRWLSKGQVLIKIVRLMPAYLTVLKSEDVSMYASLTNYKVQFLLHFFADVLGDLNVLNCKFQEAYADISSIGDHLTSVMETFRLAYLGSKFANDTMHTENFVKKVHLQRGALVYEDGEGKVHAHRLHLGAMYEGDVVNPQETYDGAVSYLVNLCQCYISSIVQALWERFRVDFDIFQAAKYFSPKDYDIELEKLDVSSRDWLQTLCNHFGKGESAFLNADECKGERRSFITRMRNCFKGKDMHAAWMDTYRCGFLLE
ncbi:hypothetical protein L7F22_017880 [Adiantum nelumboides]|nr:hypothetical protein [Adiantum nelumboides]